MSKNTELKLVGQPILSQVLGLIDKGSFKTLVNQTSSDYYYKHFKSWTHLVTMLFGILSRCDSMAEVCEGLKGMSGKLQHLGLESSPSKSTVGDGLRNRNNLFFEKLYYQLVGRYQSFLSDSRTLGLTVKELFVVDSTTIRLFSDMMKGVGRDPKNDGKKKGGLKVHMLIDAVQGVARFIKITEAKVHDRNFLRDLVVPQWSTVVFNKAYNDYHLFGDWTSSNVFFVTRQKDNAVYQVTDIIRSRRAKKGIPGVYGEKTITVSYNQDGEDKVLLLRQVQYQDEKNRRFVFITNNLTLKAEEIALIYKKRWAIELLFKKMKQNFQLSYFYGENENAIRTQIWCTLIAQLLLTVIQKIAKTRKAFSTVAAIIRIHLISMLDVMELLSQIKRTYAKQKSGVAGLPSLFST